MRIKKEEVLDLLHTLDKNFFNDLREIISDVEKDDFEFNDNNDNLNLHSYSEFSDLFRRHIIPYNDFFIDNDISRIVNFNSDIYCYDFIKKEEIIFNEKIHIKYLDLKSLGKFVF